MKEKTPEEMEAVYRYISDFCARYYKDTPAGTMCSPCELTNSIVKGDPEFAVHGPEHHYLIPAVLLTVCHVARGDGEAALAGDLKQAEDRSRNVLKAFCGLYGACGAAVGLGIFASVLTKTTPYSTDSWGTVNRITAESLRIMARVGGPRCCKRNTYLALQFAVSFIAKHFDIPLPPAPDIVCEFSARNLECKGLECPFYRDVLGEVPDTPRVRALFADGGIFPDRERAEPCECACRSKASAPKGTLIWKKSPGEWVEKGETICEIEVEKSIAGMPSPAAGVLDALVAESGDVVRENDVLGYLFPV